MKDKEHTIFARFLEKQLSGSFITGAKGFNSSLRLFETRIIPQKYTHNVRQLFWQVSKLSNDTDVSGV